MKLSLRKIFVVAGLAACLSAPAVAALWPNLPLVGGASYCASTSTGPSGQTCTLTVPAGPPSLQGLETVPMDTNYASGRAPQTVKAGLASFNALPISYVTGSTTVANTVTATNVMGGVVIVGSGALSPATINLPPAPIDGQQFAVSSTQTIASLTVAATSPQTISNNPTALTVSTTGAYGYRFLYRASNTTWYRLQ